MKLSTAWMVGIAASCLMLAWPPAAVRASDHADPMVVLDPDANITDLFFFPEGDRMILIFDVHRALLAPKPYSLHAYEYAIYMDLRSKVAFESDEDRARYGGTIASPEGIKPDVTIKLQLNDDATLKDKSFQGLKDTSDIRVFTGVRDDPFIFPRFFKKNTIASVISIPMSAFPAGQQDFLLWGATYKDGIQLDHVGRSNRTQQARFDALNKLPPSEHVAATMKYMKTIDDVYKRANAYKQTVPIAAAIQVLLQSRKYDFTPDVMVYSTRFPAGFPNGRRLTDDVAALTCQTGDCILQEISFIEGGWPRATANDKPFLADFPYLAEPWPDQPQMPAAPKSLMPLIVVGLIANFVVNVLLFFSLRALWRAVFGRSR